MSEDGTKHVVIVGGGFAGVACAKGLADKKGVRVTLLDKNDYHQFQPLLYQVATAELTPDDIAFDLEDIFRGQENIEVRKAEVVSADPEERRVTLADDTTIEHLGVKVFIDSKSIQYVDGSRVYYSDALTGAGFKIVNPNEKNSCGCGTSFSV